jgi:hypothetical protein
MLLFNLNSKQDLTAKFRDQVVDDPKKTIDLTVHPDAVKYLNQIKWTFFC